MIETADGRKIPDFSMTPKCGWILAEYMGRVLFSSYFRNEDILELPQGESINPKLIAKCHCFDESVEYRFLKITDEFAEEEIYEVEQETEIEPDLLSCDTIRIQKEYLQSNDEELAIRVVNRYIRDDNGEIVFDSYRMAGVFPAKLLDLDI